MFILLKQIGEDSISPPDSSSRFVVQNVPAVSEATAGRIPE